MDTSLSLSSRSSRSTPRPLRITLECLLLSIGSFLFLLPALWEQYWLLIPGGFMFLSNQFLAFGLWNGSFSAWHHYVSRAILFSKREKYLTDEMLRFFKVPRHVADEFRSQQA
jgi:hypothetical protein